MTWPSIPCCWPTPTGRCGCGRNHLEAAVGKAPLVAWQQFQHAPPTAEQMAQWRLEYVNANWALLVEHTRWLVVDCDGEAALGEATALGLPPAPVVSTGKGRHYYYLAPDDVVGRRTTKRGQSKAIDLLAGGIVIVPPSRHRTGRVYETVIPLEERPPGPAPSWAVTLLREAVESAGSAPDVAIGALPSVELRKLQLSPRLLALICQGASARYASRSEAVFAVIMGLVEAGHTNETIAAVLVDPAHGISAKPREAGPRWIRREIARARAKAHVWVLA